MINATYYLLNPGNKPSDSESKNLSLKTLLWHGHPTGKMTRPSQSSPCFGESVPPSRVDETLDSPTSESLSATPLPVPHCFRLVDKASPPPSLPPWTLDFDVNSPYAVSHTQIAQPATANRPAGKRATDDVTRSGVTSSESVRLCRTFFCGSNVSALTLQNGPNTYRAKQSL